MPTRIATGAITIMDVFDGASPISATLQNQNHTFGANSAGEITAGELALFSSELFVYIGTTRCIYHASLTGLQPNNTYRVISRNASPNTWTAGLTTVGVSGSTYQAKLTATGAPDGTGTGQKTAIVSVVLDIQIATGVAPTRVTLDITWGKAIEGANGSVINLLPSRNSFIFNELGATLDGNIVITVEPKGNIGTMSAQYLINGTGTWQLLTQGNLINQATVRDLDKDTSGGPDRIEISKENFGTANVFSVKVTEDLNSASDIVSIIRVSDGKTGAAALQVRIISSVNGQVFKNNTGSNKTLTVEVRDTGTNAIIDPLSLSYLWGTTGGTGFPTPAPTTQSITIGPNNIPNAAAAEYFCTVTYNE